MVCCLNNKRQKTSSNPIHIHTQRSGLGNDIRSSNSKVIGSSAHSKDNSEETKKFSCKNDTFFIYLISNEDIFLESSIALVAEKDVSVNGLFSLMLHRSK